MNRGRTTSVVPEFRGFVAPRRSSVSSFPPDSRESQSLAAHSCARKKSDMNEDRGAVEPGLSEALPPLSEPRLIDFVAKFVFALPQPDRRRRAVGFQRAGDLDRARVSLGLADEAMCALLSGDATLLDHKLRAIVVHGLGWPIQIELAAFRIRHLCASELFRMHVNGSARRWRMARQICDFADRYLPKTPG